MQNPNTLPPVVVGITGQMGHGKNLLGTTLNRFDPSFYITAFADTLKDAAHRIYGLSYSAMYDQTRKEVPFEKPVNMDDYLADANEVLGLTLKKARKAARTPRELLQLLGTEYVRRVDRNYWVNATLAKISGNGANAIITDVRFQNEAEAVRKVGGVVARVVRDNVVSEAVHASEALDFPADVTFNLRSGDLPAVRAAAMALHVLANEPRRILSVADFRALDQARNRGECFTSDLKGCASEASQPFNTVKAPTRR